MGFGTVGFTLMNNEKIYRVWKNAMPEGEFEPVTTTWTADMLSTWPQQLGITVKKFNEKNYKLVAVSFIELITPLNVFNYCFIYWYWIIMIQLLQAHIGVKGVVKNSETGAPISNAIIHVKNITDGRNDEILHDVTTG